MDCPSGIRRMQTLRKEPRQAPNTKTALPIRRGRLKSSSLQLARVLPALLREGPLTCPDFERKSSLVQEHSETIDGGAVAQTGGADKWGEVLAINGVIDS